MMSITHILTVAGLFVVTALAEIIGCWLPYRWLRHGDTPWLLVPAVVSLGAFAWLLTLHPGAAGRTYAAYGGIYVAVALLWLWIVDGQLPDRWDVIGATLSIAGMAVIAFAPHRANAVEGADGTTATAALPLKPAAKAK
jgi:small multidrug resistance family-3 protein